MAARKKTLEEQRLRLQLLDWGRWRRSQTYGVGYTNPNNDSGLDECIDPTTSEWVNQAYVIMRENKGLQLRAKMLKAKYEHENSIMDIASAMVLGKTIVVQQLLVAEGWIDAFVNYRDSDGKPTAEQEVTWPKHRNS